MPYEAIRRFEEALCEYTGAPYAVAVSSCSAAIELALLRWRIRNTVIEIPSRTYVGVAQSIVRQGFKIRFNNIPWEGCYRLFPTDVVDSAKRFTSNMYIPGTYQCVSFHSAKTLGDTQGGAILHESEEFDRWARKARFDGRSETVPLRDDKDIILGLHCYMSVDVASRLHARLKSHSFPKHNHDQCPEGFLEREYGDLSQLECFKPYTV